MCSSGLLWFIFWHPLNSVMGWFFNSVEFNMDIAMLQFLQLHWFSTTENVRFSFFFFQIYMMQLYASAYIFLLLLFWHLLVLVIFIFAFFLLYLSYAPQALWSSVCLEFAPLSRVLRKYEWCLNTIFSKQGI